MPWVKIAIRVGQWHGRLLQFAFHLADTVLFLLFSEYLPRAKAKRYDWYSKQGVLPAGGLAARCTCHTRATCPALNWQP
jgi:hypothetical protein